MARRRHGYSGTRTYIIWKAMLYRARHAPQENYLNIQLHPEWVSFENFLKDMGECPSTKHSIDRIDNSKGYEPQNCRWATSQQQVENRTVTDWVTYKGETKTLTSWARVLGMPRLAIFQRLYRLGWTVEKTFETPLRKFNGPIRKN